jgi:predicted nucleotidyltransferase
MKKSFKYPEKIENDLKIAVKILKDAGCSDIYVFGSLAAGDFRGGSDIDLAVRGCPGAEFFTTLGKLMLNLESKVDLVRLDRKDAFTDYLLKEGELVRIDQGIHISRLSISVIA